MTYKQHLEIVNTTTHFYLYKAVAAVEVNHFATALDMELTDDQFEMASKFVYDWIQCSEASANEVAMELMNGLHDGDITWEDFDKYDHDEYQSNTEVYVNSKF